MASSVKTGVFEIFKIEPGPSSSHTIDPMRAAFQFLNLLRSLPEKTLAAADRIDIRLFGSLSSTGKGHGTDRYLLSGLLGWEPASVDSDKFSSLLADSQKSLICAFQHNQPATVPMAFIFKSNTFIIFSITFALIAIVTSYVTNGLGLRSFNRDLLENMLRLKNRILVTVLTFLPPLIISYFFPDIFLKAIDIVGGVGIVILFGLLPSCIAFRKAGSSRSAKMLALVMFVLFFLVLCFQCGQYMHIIKLEPEVLNLNKLIVD